MREQERYVLYWDQLFPSLSNSEDEAIVRFKRCARIVTLREREPVFHVGSPCENYLLVVAGRVRVLMISKTGREILLYHVGPGESCVLTTSCLLAGEPYPAKGVAESAVTAFAVSKYEFNDTLKKSPAFQHFVVTKLGKQFAALIIRMSEVAFGSIAGRMAQVLLQQQCTGNGVKVTHQGLAVEMGTAREVVSRQLKDFEAHGWVRLGRGYIEILDQPALQGMLAHTGN